MARVPNLIMGTAGHVDHGKTTLVKVLTGVDLDTLPEERERGLTINLGFTSFETPSGIKIGVVDVPGHKKFIKTMMSGAHGIDFTLFIIASDDSVMPQTKEHLEILKLLGVRDGIVVMTKTDLVDEDLLEIAETDVNELVEGSFLEEAPIVKVSSATGQGIDGLVKEIEKLAGSLRPRERGTYFRLFVDRTFKIAGAGTVITGTSISGSVAQGDEVVVLPGGGRARIRKIEMHGESVDKAKAGQRTAINLKMVDKTEVERGDLIASPGVVRPTFMIDARLTVLKDYPRPVRHWDRVRFYIGTRETFGRLVLLDSETTGPGDSVLVQIRLEAPVPAMLDDPFIIRDFSSSWTMGGGIVLDAHPTKHKRKKLLAAHDLAKRETGYLEELIELETKKAGYFIGRNEVAISLNAPLDKTGAACADLVKNGSIVALPPKKSPWLIHKDGWDRTAGRICGLLNAHHQSLPQLKTGISEQELRAGLSRSTGVNIEEEPFRHMLNKMADDRILRLAEGTYVLESHTAVLGEDDEAALAVISAMYADNPMSPPSTEDVYKNPGLPKAVVREFVDKQLKEENLVRVSRDFLFDKKALDSLRQSLLEYLDENGEFTVAEFRDMAKTSRKYAIPLLNFFDNEGSTVRDGDLRKKGPNQK